MSNGHLDYFYVINSHCIVSTLNIEQHHDAKCSNAKLFTLTAAYILEPGIGENKFAIRF